VIFYHKIKILLKIDSGHHPCGLANIRYTTIRLTILRLFL
jgi:hypothetical protein